MEISTINTLIIIIFILSITNIMAIQIAVGYRKKNKINYSNYQNCLLALAEADPQLAEYLSKKELETKKA